MPQSLLPAITGEPSPWDEVLMAFLAEKLRRSGSRRTVESYSRMLNQSDTLLMFLLRAERPDKYRDRVSVAVDTEQMIQRECQRLATEYGLDPKEVLAEAKQIVARYSR